MAKELTPKQETFEADFIVVGAGSAGCVMAARLSRGPGDQGRCCWKPAARTTTAGSISRSASARPLPIRRVNWCYETEPDPGAGGRKIFWPRGKVLGGSSSINGMVYIRGQHEDFDHWRQLGNHRLVVRRRAALFQARRASDPRRRRLARHRRAALRLGCHDRHPIVRGVYQGRIDAGFPRNDDFNGAKPGRRRLSPDHHAQRQALLDRGRLSASGDEPAQPAGRHRCADREDRCSRAGARSASPSARTAETAPCGPRARSILCGGAVELAADVDAVGHRAAAEHLADIGIPVVHHLPGVGQSLQDHYSAAIKLKCTTADHGQRRDAEQAEEAEGRPGISTCCKKGPLTMITVAGGAVRPHPAGTGDAGRQMLDRDVQRRPAAGRAAQMVGLHAAGLSAASGKPRRDQAEIRRSGRRAGNAAELPGDRDGPPHDRRRAEAGPPDLLATPHMQRFIAIRIPARRRRCAPMSSCWIMPATRRHRVPPDQHLQDGHRSDGGGRSRNCGCTGSKGCAWSTPRSCRRWCPATPTPRRS